MGLVLDVQRLTSVSAVTPLTYAAGNFGAGLAKADTLAGIMSILIRPFGGNIYIGMAGKTASSSGDSWLIIDKEPFGYTGSIRELSILAAGATTDVFLELIDEA